MSHEEAKLPLSPEPRAAVLWTGGKDSCLALQRCRRDGYRIDRLVTFAPEKPNFLAHPLEVMKLQSAALGLPHQVITVGEPYGQSYRQAIITLQQSGISALITGDIDLVAGLPNWVRQCAEGLELEIVMPLWNRPREELMREIVAEGFHVIFSCVKRPWFTADWLGRAIDSTAIEQLKAIAPQHSLDICGENGEYHTLVLDGPGFARAISLKYRQAAQGDMMHLIITDAELSPRCEHNNDE